ADVYYNDSRYSIISQDDSTQVFIGKANPQLQNSEYSISSQENSKKKKSNDVDLIIKGSGSDSTEFDILNLLGKIMNDYPQTNTIPQINWYEKTALSIWSFLYCSFDSEKINGKEYEVISIPLGSKEIKISFDDEKELFYLSTNDDKRSISLTLSLNQTIKSDPIIYTDNTKILSVEISELKRAIYRGAHRTGGILLERIEPPTVAEVERSYGKGKLIYVDGNRVLLAKGTHREIGEASGALLKKEIRKMVDATLYTMCWVYTIDKKEWFIDVFKDAYRRESPFIPERFQEEMAGMAETSGIPLKEIQLTNVFPALFHCSGFAVFNSATVDGKLYHGRVLDYIVDLGLQFNAVVYIVSPDNYNAFANVSYTGFIGSVTGMNEKQVTFGEMGGKGEGDWDGMPMAFLMRDGLERANNLDEALTIFRETPRTCEYYYVISDSKIPDARGLSTSPERFIEIKPNQVVETLDEPVEDAVLMSAGKRYKKLVERVKENFGKIDAETAIHLMDRPVAMKSNLHNALFAPESMEFWVANAGLNTPAAKEPYYRYDFKSLLKKLAELK
ncbi:MAG: C45 family peptidase, partial [Bacteroidota bacterium]